MKRKESFVLAAAFTLCCAMLGCGKDNVVPNTNPDPEPVVTPVGTTIYGTVFNSVTHEPVIGAEIEIGQNGTNQAYFGSPYNDKISSSVSGSEHAQVS